MFFFTSHISLQKSKVFESFTDWHCHLLPGVDDGIRSMQDTLSILKQYEEWGVREVWFTPHIMEDVPNTTEGLQARFLEVQKAYQGSIVLHLGAEYMMDNLFEERIKKNDLLPLGKDKNYLLIETSYFSPPMDLFHTLEKICAKGYNPILAHPERYMYMNQKEYKQLQEMKVIFQLNLFSLLGAYGNIAKQKAELMLKKGLYQIVGTDTHSQRFLLHAVNEKKVKSSLVKKIPTCSSL